MDLFFPFFIYFFWCEEPITFNLGAESWHSLPNNSGRWKRRVRLEKLTVIHLLLWHLFWYWIKKVLAATTGSARCWRSTFQGGWKGMSEDVRLIHLKNKLSGINFCLGCQNWSPSLMKQQEQSGWGDTDKAQIHCSIKICWFLNQHPHVSAYWFVETTDTLKIVHFPQFGAFSSLLLWRL